MFETTFTHSSTATLPHPTSMSHALSLLHDFNTVIHLSPECNGFRAIPSPVPNQKDDHIQHYEVEDQLHFLPRYLWSGNVKYTADFLPQHDGCDITVHAPGGLTSHTKWRLTREAVVAEAGQAGSENKELAKDLRDEDGTGVWYVQIVSEAACSLTYANFVKGFLKDSHQKLLEAYVEKVKEGPARA
ncbi:unnamed protein product [Zymoseptoria tritici ST99CH_1E4]|uniref:DUF7053 domain-containing protein n=1 Tax=Zymoseptoria tritici ST99CH_1E4 TaxID=1276532 RepID=A0A2H1FZW4_ZYMTR|nr:unnamed protein product [Zymoseptoria tritici ST99CH_1E4]